MTESENVVRLMEENLLAVFNERDPQRRLTVVRRNYAPDVRWADPEETVVGQDRLHEKAQELLEPSPSDVVVDAERAVVAAGYSPVA
ncbi:nuclear transport factor 2 family protein [Rhodococcus sp. NPDC055112]